MDTPSNNNTLSVPPPTTTLTTARGQQSGQPTNGPITRTGRGNDRTRHNTYNNNRNRTNTTTSSPRSFKGNTDGMNGHVFQCHDETHDKQQFTKTVDALLEYINKELDHAADIASLCDDFTVIDLTSVTPSDLATTETSLLKKKLWEKAIERYLERVNELDSNLRHLFAVIYGQCSYNLQTKLLTVGDFEKMNEFAHFIFNVELENVIRLLSN